MSKKKTSRVALKPDDNILPDLCPECCHDTEVGTRNVSAAEPCGLTATGVWNYYPNAAQDGVRYAHCVRCGWRRYRPWKAWA